jgi:anti-sigma B factor antagonist
MIYITTEVTDDVVTLKVMGEVDASSSINLDNAINDVKSQGHKKIIIDAEEMNYISSAGLGVFMSYIKDFEKENIALVIFGLNEKVFNVFKMLGLDQLLNIKANAEEANKVLTT